MTLDIVARRYGQRPSAMMGVRDEYTAYCFDEAIAMRGLDAELKAMDSDKTPTPTVHKPERSTMAFGGGRLSGGFRGVVGQY